MADDAAAATVEQIRTIVARLRESWLWLAELVEPGRERTSAPVLTDAQRARQGAAVVAERADRAANAAAGRGALAPAPAGARLDVIAAQAVVHGLVLDAARRVAAAAGAVYVGRRAGDAAVLDALDWLDGGYGAARWAVDRAGAIVPTPPGVLDQMRDVATGAAVDRMLQRADAAARSAARVTDDPVAPAGRCPACSRRSLQWRMPGADRRAWSVECTSERCLCSGTGCGCGQKVRYPGRRHAWAAGELEGPYGLWWAMDRAAAARPHRRVGSEREGHGGWPDRGIVN